MTWCFSTGKARAGVTRISVGAALARYAYGALISAGRELAEKGTFEFSADAAGFKEIEDLLQKGGGSV